MSAIVTENLTKFYGKHRGIEGVSLSVGEGEIFGFLGPNGAGKTTTIRLLLDFIRPTRGRAEVLGLDAQRDSMAVRRRVGYLPGEPGLYDHLTGNEYLDYMASLRAAGAADGRGGGAGRRASGHRPAGWGDLQRRRELADRFDIDLGRRIKTLSRGMKQKVAIIQAFMHGADLLILDEPTSGLDPIMQHAFYELLAEERSRGRTIFMSSHILSEVERVCSRVAIIRNGSIALVEDVESLVRRRVKKVEVTFAAPVGADKLALPGAAGAGGASGEQTTGAGGPTPAAAGGGGQSGIRGLALKGNVATFRVDTPSIPALLDRLAGLPVADLVIENPTLEDIFFEFFGSEAAGDRPPATPGDHPPAAPGDRPPAAAGKAAARRPKGGAGR